MRFDKVLLYRSLEMEEKRSLSSIILIVLIVLVLALSGFIVYDKLLENNKSDDSSSKVINDTSTVNVDIKHLLSMMIIKRDNKDNVESYKISDLTDSDINDIICSIIIQDENVVDDSGTSFQMRASEVEAAIKEVYGIESSKFNFKAGADNYGIHNLTSIEVNGTKYYKTERKEGALLSIPNSDLYNYGDILNVSYKDDVLIIECEVVKYEEETPYYTLLGNATIKFDISRGIKFISFEFKKEDVINTYSNEIVME